MKITALSASLLALTLFTVPALSAKSGAAAAGEFMVAQAADDEGAGASAVDKFLAAKRAPAQMQTDRLQIRLQRAKVLLNSPDITDDQRNQLTALIAAMEAELSSRSATQQQAQTEQPEPPAPAEQVTEAPANNKKKKKPAVQAEQQPAVETPAVETPVVDAPAVEMAPAAKPKPAATAETAAPNPEIVAILNDQTPLKDMNPKELRDRFRKALALSKSSGISNQTRRQLREAARAARAELDTRTAATTEQPATTGGGTVTKPADTTQNTTQQATTPPAAKAVSAEAEAKARALLADTTAINKMATPDLRRRLQSMRDLLAGNQISAESNRALRQKLASERQVLRARVNGQQAAPVTQPDAGTGAGKPKPGAGSGNGDVNITIILNDRRPSDRLKDDELRRRIDVYRTATLDNRYAEAERAFWRQTMERDRRLLRERLLDQRQRRKQRLNDKNIDIDIGLNFQPDRRPPPYVFAAEAEEDDLEEVLAAPPRRKLERRYTLDEVEQSPNLRDAVARIEIDTVRFGFGESTLREEEVENLDRIAEIMEKILSAHPGEVFMIEGHTDAVGSEAANQELSRQRARAVKEALVTYYVIPPENLKPVGFGERFLKIPTLEAEAENRRVSIARITALVGELSD